MKTSEIADFLKAELVGNGDIEIIGVAALESASKREISFVAKAAIESGSQAGCFIAPLDFEDAGLVPVIKTLDPKLAFAKIAAILHPAKQRSSEIHITSVISNTALVGTGVFVGAFVCIGDDSHIGDRTQIRQGSKIGKRVKVGNNCVIHPNVFIEDGCTIGDSVILHAGVVIGTDGFGYVRGDSEYVKFPQLGTVVIENDVEIGANSCIDRGALGETRIGKGTKIDNLVQIAHNVWIGERVVIAAQTGISGSTVIEDDCVIGGQVGMGDHALVKSGAVIGSQAGVLPGKIVRPGVWWGTPVQPLEEYKRQNAYVKGLARLRATVKQLQDQIDNLTRHNT
ncbi:MAG: UDP-3-O-(3-hydroxymyristoyl)glucosamine N-acyltransferase [Pyrinomonadaceae bacterium]